MVVVPLDAPFDASLPPFQFIFSEANVVTRYIFDILTGRRENFITKRHVGQSLIFRFVVKAINERLLRKQLARINYNLAGKSRPESEVLPSFVQTRCDSVTLVVRIFRL